MYNRAEHYDVFSVQVSKPGMELSRSYVLEQVEYLLLNSAKKEGGMSYATKQSMVIECVTCIIPRLFIQQLYSNTMAMAGGTLGTGVSEMASSPSEISLTST